MNSLNPPPVGPLPDPAARRQAPRARRGRPSAAESGAAEERLLDAAQQQFFTQGYGSTTLDAVIAEAGVGRSTLYNRHPTKASLFAAVVHRASRTVDAALIVDLTSRTARQRLITTGLRLADVTLTPGSIALMRVTAAEATTLPDVAREGFAVGFAALVHCAASAITGTAQPPEGETTTRQASRFVELALHPLFMHAFYGTDLTLLRQRAEQTVPEAAAWVLSPAADGS